MVGLAAVNVAEVALAKVSLDAGDFGLGLLMASAGLGLILGSVLGGEVLERRSVAFAYGSAIALMAVGIGLAALAPNVWIAAACVVVSGFGNGVASVCNPVLVQRGAPDHLRGRAFTAIMSVNAAAFGLGMVVAGALTDELGARWVWGLAAVVLAFVAGIAAALARGIEPEPDEAAPDAGHGRRGRGAAGGPVGRPPLDSRRGPPQGVDAGDARGRRARGRQACARAGDQPGRERRSARLRPRARALSRTPAVRTSSASPARRASASRA